MACSQWNNFSHSIIFYNRWKGFFTFYYTTEDFFIFYYTTNFIHLQQDCNRGDEKRLENQSKCSPMHSLTSAV